MSESSNESDRKPEDAPDSSEPGVIGDEELPEDLQAEKNPLARDPEEAEEERARGSGDGIGGSGAGGQPDPGQPGS
jgi:hypothetical protein